MIKFVIVLSLLAMGSVLYVGCGEGVLPPPNPPNTGTIIITGGAV